MGMFDFVVVQPEQHCAKCGQILRGWQSKDLECTMATVPYWRVANFYTSCDDCGTWHEYVLKAHGERPLSDYRLLTEIKPEPPIQKLGEKP